MTFVPPPHLQGPVDLHRPLITDVYIDTRSVNFNGGDVSMLQAIANGIVEKHASELDRWIAGMRQQNAIAPIGYVQEEITFPDMAAVYIRNQSDEQLEIVVRPTTVGGQLVGGTDINLDGYIAMISVGGDDKNYTGATPSFSFLLNGDEIYSGELPLSLVALAFRFGDTALRCHSLADSKLDDPYAGPSTPFDDNLVPALIPDRPELKAFTNVLGPAATETGKVPFTIEKHHDLFGYWPYNINNPLINAGSGQAAEGGGGGGGGGGPAPLPEPTVTEVVLDIKLLNVNGKNTLRVINNVVPLPWQNFGWTYYIVAEFYDRKVMDRLTQSWHQTNPQGIQANDRPLFFGMQAPFVPTMALEFDLTPGAIGTTYPPTIETNPVSAYDPDDDKLTQWADCKGRGLWRPGDSLPLIPFPPPNPWFYAVDATLRAVQAWKNALWCYLEVVLRGPGNTLIYFATNTINEYSRWPADKAVTPVVNYAQPVYDPLTAIPDYTVLTGPGPGFSSDFPYGAVDAQVSSIQSSYNNAWTRYMTADDEFLHAPVYAVAPEALSIASQALADIPRAQAACQIMVTGGNATTVGPDGSPISVAYGTNYLKNILVGEGVLPFPNPLQPNPPPTPPLYVMPWNNNFLSVQENMDDFITAIDDDIVIINKYTKAQSEYVGP